MTLLSPEHVANAKANVDAFFGVAGKAFEVVEKLVALNLQTVKATLAETQENLTKVSGTEPQQWFTLQAGFIGPSAEKSLSYGRQVFDLPHRPLRLNSRNSH